VGRDQSRAMACVGLVLGKMRGQQSEPFCFLWENGNEKKRNEICPHFGTRFYPHFSTRSDHLQNDEF
jgi:hypothetical protein